MQKSFLTSVAEIKLLHDDFARIEYFPNTHIDLSQLEEALQIYRKLLGDRKFYLLTVVNAGVTLSERARNYWTTDQRSKIKIAEAFVLKSTGHSLLAKFITIFQPPKHELKIFSNEKKALAWLNSVRNKKAPQTL